MYIVGCIILAVLAITSLSNVTQRNKVLSEIQSSLRDIVPNYSPSQLDETSKWLMLVMVTIFVLMSWVTIFGIFVYKVYKTLCD